jgi:hypothetical protein
VYRAQGIDAAMDIDHTATYHFAVATICYKQQRQQVGKVAENAHRVAAFALDKIGQTYLP